MDQELIEVAGINKDTLVQKIEEKYSKYIENERFHDLHVLQEIIDSFGIKVEPPRDIIFEKYREYFNQMMDLGSFEEDTQEAAWKLKALYSITKIPIPDDLIQEIQERYEYCINDEQYTHLEKLMDLVGDIVPLSEDMVQKKYKDLLDKKYFGSFMELYKITKIKPEDSTFKKYLNIFKENLKKSLYSYNASEYWKELVQNSDLKQLVEIVSEIYEECIHKEHPDTFTIKMIYEKTGIKPQFSEDEIQMVYERLLRKWDLEGIEEFRDVIGFMPKFPEALVQEVYTNEIFEELFSGLPDEAHTIVNGIEGIYQLTKVKPKLSEWDVQPLYDALIENEPELIPTLYKLTGIAPKSVEAYIEVISYIMKEED